MNTIFLLLIICSLILGWDYKKNVSLHPYREYLILKESFCFMLWIPALYFMYMIFGGIPF